MNRAFYVVLLSVWVITVTFAPQAVPVRAQTDPPPSGDPRCKAIVDNIMAMAQEDNCITSDDCAAVNLPPPIGCNRPVSRPQAQSIEQALTIYQQNCAPVLYNCMGPPSSIWCRDGRCVREFRLGGIPAPSITDRDSNGRPLR